MAGTLYCSIFLYVGKVLVVGTLKGYHQIGGRGGPLEYVCKFPAPTALAPSLGSRSRDR